MAQSEHLVPNAYNRCARGCQGPGRFQSSASSTGRVNLMLPSGCSTFARPEIAAISHSEVPSQYLKCARKQPLEPKNSLVVP